MFLCKNLTLSGPSTATSRPVSQDRMSLVDLGKRLLEAAKKGDTEEVRTLMSSGAPFTTDWLGTSPLHFAAHSGHLQTAEVLLRAGISRDARTKVDRTPLHVASQTGNVQIVELLIRNQADIEAKDMLKMTPLHWASEMGHLGVVELLVKQGADINCENKFDKTPIDIAGAKGRVDILAALSQNGEITIPASSIMEEEVGAEELLAEHVAMETVVSETEIQTATDSIPISLSSPISNIEAVPLTIVQNSHKTTVTEAGGTEQSSTSVLATLAALAEATAPISSANTSTTEAMNWLENHGITMISTNDGNILASAVESGQSITLTEAGKLAINLIKQQAMSQTTEETVVTEEQEAVVDSDIENVVGDSGTQKVITIVSDESHIPTSESPILVEVAQEITTEEITETHAAGDCSEPPTKRFKKEEETTAVDIAKLIQAKGNMTEPENDDLRRQLEEVQRQAQEYKQQLLQKEKETEVYKKRLIALTPTKKS